MITISLCMIVKNEEAVLKRCLDSIADLMDEIIIVDTGSCDRTKEIAREYTDKIYDFQWVDDFSKARNFSFSKATKDYIYVADADEILEEESRKKFYQLKEALLPEIDIVQMYYCNQLLHNTTYNFNREYRPKIYKRLRSFQWIEPLHERVLLEPVIYDSDIEIVHMPLCNHGARDFSGFLKMIERGERLSKHLHTMYAKELFITGETGDFLCAKQFFISSIQDTSRSIDEIREAACVLTKVSRLERNLHNMFKYALKDIVIGASAETCYEIGEYFLETQEYEEAGNWFYNAAYETESILNIQYSQKMPRKKLLECYELLAVQAGKKKNKELKEKYRKLAEEVQMEIQ